MAKQDEVAKAVSVHNPDPRVRVLSCDDPAGGKKPLKFLIRPLETVTIPAEAVAIMLHPKNTAAAAMLHRLAVKG